MERKICGAKAKSTGKPCQHEAGWGTDHTGTGRCKLHGGASRKGVESGAFKHGEESKYFDLKQIKGFAEWREQCVGPTLDLEEDILAMIYAVRELLLQEKPVLIKVGNALAEIPPDANYISTCLERISRAWERMIKRHEGETIYIKFTPEIERAFAAIGDAIGEHVSDPAEADAVVAAIGEALEGLNK